MARIVVQQGHVPRTSGATGTVREQELVRAIGGELAPRLAALGHDVVLIGADDPRPRCDAFVALHGDGSTNPARRGASVGYPDAAGARLAAAWKHFHAAQGWPGGFLRDNYTTNLSRYYGFRTAAPIRFLAEHGTLTNAEDQRWLFGNLDRVVAAHVLAIGHVLGHPAGAAAPAAPAPEGWRDRMAARHPDLARGSTGGHVRIAQGMMNAHTAVPPGQPYLRVDGDFGPLTESGLRTWQDRARIPVTGRIDDSVWRYWTPDTLPPVGQGHRSFLVRLVQGLMVAHKAFPGDEPEREVDGVFGPRTTTALRGWQGNVGLTANGYVDRDDWSRLLGIA